MYEAALWADDLSSPRPLGQDSRADSACVAAYTARPSAVSAQLVGSPGSG